MDIYLAYRTGNDSTGDGSEGNPYKTFDGGAKPLIEAGSLGQYRVIFTEDTNENCTIDGTVFPATTAFVCDIIFRDGVVASGGTGNFLTIANDGVRFLGARCIGWRVSNDYSRAARAFPGFYAPFEIVNCQLERRIQSDRSWGEDYTQSYLSNVSSGSINASVQNQIVAIRDTTFSGGTQCIAPSTAPLTLSEGVFGSSFNNCNLIIRRSGNGILRLGQIGNTGDNSPVNFTNCTFRLFDENNLTPPAAQACNSIQDLNDLYQTTFGTSAGNEFENCVFGATIDEFGFQTSESGYIKERHQGFFRYGISALVAEPSEVVFNPSEFTIVSDQLQRTVTTPATFSLITPELNYAFLLGRIFLHYENSNGSLDNSYSATIELSEDGTNYSAPTPVAFGLQDQGGAVFDFDYSNEPVKRVKVNIAVVGTANTLLFIGMSIESRTLEDIIPQGARTVIVQADNYLLKGGNYSFEMPEELRSIMTVPNKQYYDFDEIVAEAGANANVSVEYEPTSSNTNITKVVVESGKTVTVFTFKQE